ncbi:hypothetical protein C2E23DRAFT_362963 [Lenzites betulinus]|nr:hypothetical protein C2E23DRAFT_362963 [Lenzites betulinus]
MEGLDGTELNRVYNAPTALDHDLERTKGLEPWDAQCRHQSLLAEFRKYVVGPIPVDAFIQNAVGKVYWGTDERMRMSATNAFRSVPHSADTADQIYEPLLVALNKRTKHKSRCPGFVFVNTARRSTHPARPGFAKPHVSCFTRRNVEAVQRLDRHSRSELGYAELIIQVTPDVIRDYFTDPPSGLHGERRAAFELISQWEDRQTKREVTDAFALHLALVTEIFARQYRNGFFSISLTGSRARLLRWDRAGCLVSEAFDIREHPEHLCYFLWRFSRTIDEMRGHDITVSPATLQQELQFRDVVREYVRSQLELEGDALDKAVSQHYCPGRAAVVVIYPQHEPHSHDNVWRFIISRPVVSPLCLVGRGTRGNWAVECTTSRLVFLKDTWRVIDARDDTAEGDFLEELNELEVRNIPALFAHGDVPDYVSTTHGGHVVWQSTITGAVAKVFERCSVAGKLASVTNFQRYRLAVSTVGYDLSTVRGTEELLHATYDALTAMRDTFSKASRIHRDISLGNIILVKVPGQDVRRGYLIDWETSDKADDAGHAVHAGRAGTWLFMSARMLDKHEADTKQTFLDDMESLIHVVTYCALRYLPHKLAKRALLNTMYRYFERATQWFSDPPHGGDAKANNSLTRQLIPDVQFGSDALAEWITTMLQFQRPGPSRRYNYGEQWTADDVDVFWSEFLRTHALERDNRIVHDVTKDENREYNELSITPPSIQVSPPMGKRSATGRNSEMPSPKRARTLRSREAPGPLSKGIVASRVIDGRRRSERIRTVQDRLQPARPVASHTRRLND